MRVGIKLEVLISVDIYFIIALSDSDHLIMII